MRPILPFLIVLALACPSTAQVQVRTHGSASSTNGTTASVTLDTTAADFLIVAVASLQGTSITRTDSNGNTWTPLTAASSSTWSAVQCFFSVPSSVGTNHQFSVTGSYPAIAVAAFSGVAHTAPLDQQHGAAQESGTTMSPGSMTPSSAGELLLSCLGSNASPSAIDSGFLMAESRPFAAGLAFSVGLAYRIGTAGSITPTWTVAPSSNSAATVAAFTANSGSSAAISRVVLVAGQSNAVGLLPQLRSVAIGIDGGTQGATAMPAWSVHAALDPVLRCGAAPLDAFVFWQGESDALTAAAAAAYEGRLRDLIARVRSACGNAALPAIILSVLPNAFVSAYPYLETIRTAQQVVGAEAGNVFVNVAGYTYDSSGHLSTSDYLAIAQLVLSTF